MSVLIKGMKMPDSCIACKFGREVNYTGDFEEKCLINDKCGYVSVRKPRLDTCPLVEVKTPHGRLIDADAVNKAMDERIKKLKDDRSIYEASCVSTALDMFAPTVIEAEGSEVTE